MGKRKTVIIGGDTKAIAVSFFLFSLSFALTDRVRSQKHQLAFSHVACCFTFQLLTLSSVITSYRSMRTVMTESLCCFLVTWETTELLTTILFTYLKCWCVIAMVTYDFPLKSHNCKHTQDQLIKSHCDNIVQQRCSISVTLNHCCIFWFVCKHVGTLNPCYLYAFVQTVLLHQSIHVMCCHAGGSTCHYIAMHVVKCPITSDCMGVTAGFVRDESFCQTAGAVFVLEIVIHGTFYIKQVLKFKCCLSQVLAGVHKTSVFI